MPSFYASRSYFLTSILIFQSFFWLISANTIPKSIFARSKTSHHKDNGSDSSSIQYKDFQISDGVTGEAPGRLKKLLLDPYGLNLTSDFVIEPESALAAISKADYRKIKEMSTLAKDAEGDFNKEINEHKDDKELVKKLKAGKVANKCLKLLLQQLYLSIDEATKHNETTTEKLALEKPKLIKNYAADTKHPGQPMVSAISLEDNKGDNGSDGGNGDHGSDDGDTEHSLNGGTAEHGSHHENGENGPHHENGDQGSHHEKGEDPADLGKED
ncbi:hypothetical protein CROQUDRAFT_100247 [Cronartium quercuum f. sp. fusiforme G11]|uniref:Uncharacterized protein n=1 Tax=Cronartium quercuum f. sp. fusiforme G11 TaxID=708437 RepID=A0A9P6NAS5_9BASI|nr:hypothetical protein CROQUDRAFT_100247 [Cronartium quercuum f. sp. fusiforme G11]